MKAGLMEIADVFVINKADREGAERAAHAIRTGLELRTSPSEHAIPVQLTVASQNTGVAEVVDRFEEHLAFLTASGQLESRRQLRLERRLEELLRAGLWAEFRAGVGDDAWAATVVSLAQRRETPHQAAARLVRDAEHGV